MRDSVFEICYFRNNFLRGRLRKALSKESIGQAVGNIGLASVIQKKRKENAGKIFYKKLCWRDYSQDCVMMGAQVKFSAPHNFSQLFPSK